MSGTLVGLLRERTETQATDTAFRFLADQGPQEISYAALETGARAVAARLQQLGAARGDRVLLLYPPGLDYVTAFFGCLFAGTVPVPAYPPSSLRTVGRIAGVAVDSGAQLALTTAEFVPVLEQGVADTPLAGLRSVATDVLAPSAAEQWRTYDPGPGTTAFLQYTSGSTAAPKGVVVTHRNLLHNMEMISRAFGVTPASRAVIWLPPYHDMGLIGGILTPLYTGFPVTLMSPMSFLRDPMRWLRTISEERADVSGGPNFAYEMCVRAATDADRESLDLSSWKVAFNGAEPIRPETLDGFVDAFGDRGFKRSSFLSCYGLAEATLFVTGATASAEPVLRTVDPAALHEGRADRPAPGVAGRTLVGSGRAFPGQDVRIAGPESGRPLPDLAIGEILVRGESVTAGYWGNRERTDAAFGALLDEDAPGGPYLRTGDLGFLDDGELFVTGRSKDLIIVRGRNFYPTDIERAADHSHPALRKGCGAAFAVDVDGEQALVLVQEVDGRAVRDLAGEEAVAAVRAAVVEQCDIAVHDVVLVKPGGVPKTTSGKIQRRVTRARYTAGEFQPLWAPDPEPVADRTPAVDRAGFLALGPTERTAALRAVLRAGAASLAGVSASTVDEHRPLSALGLDSLAAVRLANSVQYELGVVLPPSALLGGGTLAAAADAGTVDDTVPDAGAAPDAAHEAAALSPGQHALWQAHQEDPTGAAYTIPVPVRLRGPLDTAVLRGALDRLARRHAVLRTRYPVDRGRPVPVTDESADVPLTVVDATDWDQQQVRRRLEEEVHRPFDLEHGPVLRATVLTRPESVHLLLITLHHLAGDLWSTVLLMDELGRLYEAGDTGRPLPAPMSGYGDHVRRRAALLGGPAGQELSRYWQRRLADAPTALDLPTDAPHPAAPSYRSGRHLFTLAAGFSDRLRECAAARGVTLYSLLLSAFHIALHHASGQDDVVIGCPAANRTRRAEEEVIGYFVNVLPVRASLGPKDTPAGFLQRLHADALNDLDHQEYPLPLMLEDLRPRRAPGRSPLFQAAFLFQKPHTGQESAPFVLGTGSRTVDWGGIEAAPLGVEQRTAPYELMITLVDTGAELQGALQHSTDVYASATAERLAAHYRQTLADILDRPDATLAELCPDDLLQRRTAARQRAAEDPDDGYVPPRTDTERALAEIWEEVLGTGPVGAHDDFFDLGGHSLLAAQLISAVRDTFDVEVPVRAVMQSRTLAESAAFVDALLWARDSARDRTPAATGTGPAVPREEGEL